VKSFVSYEIENDRAFKRNIDEAIKAVGDLRFPFGEISRDIYKNSRKNFILKGNGKYPPLSENYAEYKKKKVGIKPILVFNGDLRDSVTKARDSNNIRSIGKTSLVQGSKVPYARYVQEGTKKMPERKYYFIDNAQAIRFTRIIDDYVTAKTEVIGNVS